MKTITLEGALKLEAGPELDRLINEVVFGREFQKPRHGNCCTCQTCGHPHDECICGYSEDISKAWELTKPETWGSHWAILPVPCDGMWAIWQIRDARGDKHIVRAPTAMLAICRAALIQAEIDGKWQS